MDFAIAQTLAADLAGARVDPNEAQKALAYLRKKQDGKQFFIYLRAIVQDGRAVIRSSQTLDYYRNLLAACERHLRGMDADEMLQTLGWALRLLRYYRVVPQVVQEKAGQSQSPEPPEGGTTAEPRKSPPTAPQIPGVGTIFTANVLVKNEDSFEIEVPGFSPQEAVGVIPLGPQVPNWRPGRDKAKVQVVKIRKRDGLCVLLLKRP